MLSVYSWPSGKAVDHAYQPVVEMARLGGYLVATIIVLVLGGEAAVKHCVVVALIQDEDAVVLERGIELGQRASAVRLLVQVGERIAETDNSIVLAVDVPVQPAPVCLHGLEDQVAVAAVSEGLCHHGRRTVCGSHVET